MNTNERESDSLDPLVEAVVGGSYEVSNTLGARFLEKVYERALIRELLRGLRVNAQVSFPIVYKGQCVGDYVADLSSKNAYSFSSSVWSVSPTSIWPNASTISRLRT